MTTDFKQDLLRVTAFSNLPIVVLSDDFRLGLAYAEKLKHHNNDLIIKKVIEIDRTITDINDTTIIVTNKETKRLLHPYLANYTQLTVHHETGGKTYLNILNCESSNRIQKIAFKDNENIKLIDINKDEETNYHYVKNNKLDYIHFIVDTRDKFVNSLGSINDLIRLSKSPIFKEHPNAIQGAIVYVFKLNKLRTVSNKDLLFCHKTLTQAHKLKDIGILIAIEKDPREDWFEEVLSQHY